MVASVLVVCGSDQCVAPAAAALLRASFARTGATDVQVVSAGVRAAVGREWCTVMREELEAARDVPVGQHSSHQLTADLVRRADLVLVTERKYRGTTRLMDARSAPRTFTILEASLLARAVRAARPSRTAPGAQPAPTSTLAQLRWLLAEMDAMRGLVALPEEAHGWHRRLRVVAGVDLLDPDVDHRSHKRTLSVLREALDDLVSTVDEVATHPALV